MNEGGISDFVAKSKIWTKSGQLLPGAPRWKSQCLAPPSAGFGDQVIRIFWGKKKFPIPLEAGKKNFNHLIFKTET